MLPHSSTNRQDAPLDLFQFFNFHSKVKARLPQTQQIKLHTANKITTPEIKSDTLANRPRPLSGGHIFQW